VWIRDDIENPWQTYKNIIADFKCKLSKKEDNLTPLFSVEGGALLEADSDRIYKLYADGIRFLTLTWNGENRIAGGINSEKALTAFGKEVICKMNELKMGCDLSHLNEKSFYPSVEAADFPLATHSNCRDICNHSRNLTFSQIKLIAEKGGVIGLCFYPAFLGDNVYEAIYKNIFYLCDKGLEDHVAIGSDFDGAQMDNSLYKIEQIPCLFRYLQEKGLKKELLYKIFYKNAYNFIAKM
jgi:membrane dipeptidase